MAITISNSTLSAVIEERGAELVSLKQDNREYMWEGNPYYWGKHSPVLFPIVGTLKGNRYTYAGHEYEMSRHGFARDNVFTVRQHTEDTAVFVLSHSEETLKVYPFEFDLLITYKVIGNTLSIGYEVKNKTAVLMPFSLGAHPAFALKEDIQRYSLFFEKDSELLYHKLDNDLIGSKTGSLPLSNHRLPLDYTLFKEDAIIIKSPESDYTDLLEDGKPLLRVAFYDFPSLGLWTKPGAPFLCIEPWQGYSDNIDAGGDITKKEGIRLLDSNDVYTAELQISLF